MIKKTLRSLTIFLIVACISLYLPLTSITMANAANVLTPKGSSVYVVSYAEWSPGEISQMLKSARNLIKNNKWNATPVSGRETPTGKYNCHSYAWYSTSSTNPYWMNYFRYYNDSGGGWDANLSKYWSDGSYNLWVSQHIPGVSIESIPSGINGAKAWYPNGDHSGIVTNSSTKITSKWGNYGVYTHSVNHCPYSTYVDMRYYKYYKN